jgi:hypothetical protein
VHGFAPVVKFSILEARDPMVPIPSASPLSHQPLGEQRGSASLERPTTSVGNRIRRREEKLADNPK